VHGGIPRLVTCIPRLVTFCMWHNWACIHFSHDLHSDEFGVCGSEGIELLSGVMVQVAFGVDSSSILSGSRDCECRDCECFALRVGDGLRSPRVQPSRHTLMPSWHSV